MIRMVYSLSLPNRVLSVVAPGASMPAGHTAHGKTQLDGKATAYLCTGSTCSLPATGVEALRALLLTALHSDYLAVTTNET